MIAFASNSYTHATPIQFAGKVDRQPDRRRRVPSPSPSPARERGRGRSESPAKRTISLPSSSPLSSPSPSPSSLSSLSSSKPNRVSISISIGPSPASTARPSAASSPTRRKESVQDILRSTAIPIRRKRKPRASQRIPDGDHVADFSRLLRDDIRTSTISTNAGCTPGSSPANPLFDGLFGHIEELVEGQMIIGSDGLDASILSNQSLSTDSIPSLASPDDYSSADNISVTPSTVRSAFASERRVKQLATSEDCAQEHPLIGAGDSDEIADQVGVAVAPIEFPAWSLRKRPLPSGSSSSSSSNNNNNKNKSDTQNQKSFKSSLTASLKAIKLAAQSVSNYNYGTATSFVPDTFSSGSVFDFHPALTDDRRPPPLNAPPSPALRRYLNPNTASLPDSPAQLHFWIEPRTTALSAGSPGGSSNTPQDGSYRPKLKIRRKNNANGTSKQDGEFDASSSSSSNCSKPPSLVPMATCIPSQIRTEHASSPPVWLAADGTPSNKSNSNSSISPSASWEGTEATGALRHCEPRENRDFLRIYVCEMQMRRLKKLRADVEGKARMWLPPADKDKRPSRSAAERLRMWLPDDNGNGNGSEEKEEQAQ